MAVASVANIKTRWDASKVTIRKPWPDVLKLTPPITNNPAKTRGFIEAVTSVLFCARLFERVPQFIGESLHAFVAGVTGDSRVFNLPL